jgi:hypothetical protein
MAVVGCANHYETSGCAWFPKVNAVFEGGKQ